MKRDRLEEKIGHSFKDGSLLAAAMTHSSYSNENRQDGVSDNERLEFLGDSVLGLIVSGNLYLEHPEMPEGELTRLRASLVCESSLSAVARSLSLGEYLLLGHGEDAGGGRSRASILADATEALIGALYLDGGFRAARAFVMRFLLKSAGIHASESFRDYKTALQELVQRDRQNTMAYRMTGESGPDHAKRFFAEVLINGEPAGRGEGESKKAAEQSAAREALRRLGGRED